MRVLVLFSTEVAVRHRARLCLGDTISPTRRTSLANSQSAHDTGSSPDTAQFAMFAPPMPVFPKAPKKEEFRVMLCTCGAKDFKLRRQHNHAKESTSEAKKAANCHTDCPAAVDTPKLRRSLWRKLLGKGPKCVCPKRRVIAVKPGLIGIPAAYADCDSVTVAGRRVPFTLDMQQRRRASWTPLDAIEEDE
ncbi:hypothetical protein PRIC2_001524 [Phytophthora ramorum]